MSDEIYLGYDILSGTDANQLKAAVRLAGRDRWKPQGGVAMMKLNDGQDFFTQAVVKEFKYRMDANKADAP